MDTVEPCDHDLAVLRESYRVCAPDGHPVIMVQALMPLWSHSGMLDAHRRRCTAWELPEKLVGIGFQVWWMTYNNLVLFGCRPHPATPPWSARVDGLSAEGFRRA